MRLFTVALEDSRTSLVVLDPYTPTVLIDRSGTLQGGLAGLRILRVSDDPARIAERVHEVPDFRGHVVFRFNRNAAAYSKWDG